MNAPGLPRTPQTQAEIAEELQHVIEANETTRILVREACALLVDTVELHLNQMDAQLRRLAQQINRR